MAITKEQFIQWARSKNWAEDKYGHLQKTVNNEQYRFKISKISVRYEKRIGNKEIGKEWLRIRSGYFKDLNITEDNKLSGLK